MVDRQNETAGSRPKVLYVEDDALVARSVMRMMRTAPVDLIHADSGEACRRLVVDGAHTFRAALVDRVLPDADGVALAQEIRSETRVPVAVVSGEPRPSDVDLPWLMKPFRRADLHAFLARILGD